MVLLIIGFVGGLAWFAYQIFTYQPTANQQCSDAFPDAIMVSGEAAKNGWVYCTGHRLDGSPFTGGIGPLATPEEFQAWLDEHGVVLPTSSNPCWLNVPETSTPEPPWPRC